MQSSRSLERLLTVLEERETGLGRDDVEWAFKSAKTKDGITAWVDEYLEPATLLSKDELDLYCKLFPRHILSKAPDRAQTVRPIFDHEIQTAIESLENSTAAIKTQSRALEVQKQALLALKAQNDAPSEMAKRVSADRNRKYVQELQSLDIAAQELSDSAADQLAALQREVKSSRASLLTSITERLTADDRLLTSIGKLAPKLQQAPEDHDGLKSVEQRCRALVAFRTAETKTRVDALYRQSLHEYSSEDGSQKPAEELTAERGELEAELETLHAEIASVADMVVEHELREPILRSIKRSKDSQMAEQEKWSAYVISTLEYLASRLDVMGAHAQELHPLHRATEEISSALDDELVKPLTARAMSPIKSPTKGKHLLHATKPSWGMHSKTPSEEAVQRLLRHLDISAPSSDAKKFHKALDAALIDREGWLQEHQDSVTASTTQAVAQVMRRADEELQVVLSSLYASSDYATVHLSSKTLDERLAAFDHAIGEVGKGIAEVDAPLTGEETRRRETFIRKWSRP
ncbi:hypothetical protein H2199_008299 [Coniosporium tulheliwenetii]|uniref:Uncharacterized protein n=1 Tax=Coniosporium tulheliwenetii TaxID=3383036 RepID=A0ACC2YLF5_9PEZI|nr:hypothetical protein H2199_008299 [Cladosporium sp. JES 115]